MKAGTITLQTLFGMRRCTRRDEAARLSFSVNTIRS
jgi:hypothetical protein